MRTHTIKAALGCLTLLLCHAVLAAKPANPGGRPGGETTGNNLSFPVIWAEGMTKVLPGSLGMVPALTGEWWYWWGTTGVDPNVVPLSCPPDPDDSAYCDDGMALQATGDLPGAGWVRAYLQKDPGNVWQAGNEMASDPVVIDWIDWGDNLESNDWYTTSQVRTEVVLFKDLTTPMLAYEMRHVAGWGIDEVHGMAATGDTPPVPLAFDSLQATVYSHCARLTIQKLLVPREELGPDDLDWVPGEGWSGEDVNPPIFNTAVAEGGDGPGYYSAEINVKGRIIYGYTWNVRNLNDLAGGSAAGDYRITFSLDATCGTALLNTYFIEGSTDILVPVEEVVTTTSDESGDEGGESPEGGATAMLRFEDNLTYMDVRILERNRGHGGGGGGGSGGHGGKGK